MMSSVRPIPGDSLGCFDILSLDYGRDKTILSVSIQLGGDDEDT